MAKALYGHLPSSDMRMVAEVARLRRRVAELEALVERLELERSLDLTLDSELDQDLLAPVPR